VRFAAALFAIANAMGRRESPLIGAFHQAMQEADGAASYRTAIVECRNLIEHRLALL